MNGVSEIRIPRVGILGGTFNPVHTAHLRLAAAAAEALGLERVELMPGAVPPHKPAAGLLPFDLRCSLLEAAVSEYPQLSVSRLEGELPPPSYTWNLIMAWKKRHNGDTPLFILGAEDFAQIGTWRRGLELPGIASFLVVPRGKADEDAFRGTLERIFPGIKIRTLPRPDETGTVSEKEGELLYAAPSKDTVCLFLPLPLLDISASAVRVKWIRGESIRYLTPDPVISGLETHADEIRDCWSIFS